MRDAREGVGGGRLRFGRLGAREKGANDLVSEEREYCSNPRMREFMVPPLMPPLTSCTEKSTLAVGEENLVRM